MTTARSPYRDLLHPAVIVAALGYFVDIYDLILFSIVRVSSLRALGLDGPELFDQGLRLINAQMAGMLVGGILWGILGDKRGRISVLFGSILLYSLANLANGMVQTVDQYLVLRFIAGVGLAGELGAGITLVAEILPKQTRGLGTSFVAAFGICGAVLAALVGETFEWRTAYYIGGGLGLALLLLRWGVMESGMFDKVKAASAVSRGDFRQLFTRARFGKYLRCILIGVPLWFAVGILVTFSPEFAKEFGVAEPVSAGRAIMWCYIGLAIGDLGTGLLSQWWRSRKKVVAVFLGLAAAATVFFLKAGLGSAAGIYAGCLFLGLANGYWAIFVTIGAEQFGTNLRATVATTVPNFVRGSLNAMTFAFAFTRAQLGIVNGALVVGLACVVVALVALRGLDETFGKELDYVE